MDAYFDRFDVCEAWYVFLYQWHDGRGVGRFSYRRMSRLLTWFKPGAHLYDETDLTENGRAIYTDLVRQVET